MPDNLDALIDELSGEEGQGGGGKVDLDAVIDDLVAPRGEREEFPEISTYTGKGHLDPNFNFTKEMAIAAGIMSSLTPDAAADVIRHHLPEAKVTVDKDGYVLVEHNGQKGYMNKPGLSPFDATQAISQVGAFWPGAKFAAAAPNIIMRVLASGGAGFVTAMGLDELSQYMGSKQSNDWWSRSMAAAGEAGGELVSPVVGKMWKLGKRIARSLGRQVGLENIPITDTMRQAAEIAGFDPGDMTDVQVRTLRDAVEGTPNVQAAAAKLQQAEFNIRMSRGQATQDPGHLMTEESARVGGQGSSVQNTIETFDAGQADDITRAVARESEVMTGQSGRGVMEAAEDARAGLSDLAANYRDKYNNLYSAARDADVMFQPGAAGTMPEFIEKRLTDEQLLAMTGDGTISSQVDSAFKYLDNQLTNISRDEVGLDAVDGIRKQLLKYKSYAFRKQEWDNFDIFQSMVDGFDDWYDSAIDARLYSGDDAGLQLLKKARSAFSTYKRKFTKQGKGDTAGAIIQKLTEEEATPRQAVQWLFGWSKHVGRNDSALVFKRIKDVAGADSEIWQNLREGAWNRLAKGAEGAADSPLKVKAFSDRIRDALAGRSSAEMKILFSPEEMARMRQFKYALDRVFSSPKNTSGTAWANKSWMKTHVLRLLATATAALGISGGDLGVTAAVGGMAAVEAGIGTLEKLGAGRAMTRIPSAPARSPLTAAAGGYMGGTGKIGDAATAAVSAIPTALGDVAGDQRQAADARMRDEQRLIQQRMMR